MAITFRGTLPEVFEARQAEILYKNYTMQEKLFPQVFNMETSQKAYEDWFEVSGLGVFRTKPEGTPVTYDSPVQGVRRRITHTTYALGYRVTMEAMEDAQYDVIDQHPKDMGDAAREHDELLAWAFFNSPTSTTVGIVGDGLALASASHTILKPKDPAAATQSNLAAVALSVTGLETALTAMMTTKTREDRFMPLKPSKLVIPPALSHFAHQILNTEKEVFTNENQVSTVSSSRTGISPVVVPYLTDTDNWALTCEKSQHKLCFNTRKKLTFDSSTDSQTKDKLFDAVKRNSVVAKDWRGTWFSQV